MIIKKNRSLSAIELGNKQHGVTFCRKLFLSIFNNLKLPNYILLYLEATFKSVRTQHWTLYVKQWKLYYRIFGCWIYMWIPLLLRKFCVFVIRHSLHYLGLIILVSAIFFPLRCSSVAPCSCYSCPAWKCHLSIWLVFQLLSVLIFLL